MNTQTMMWAAVVEPVPTPDNKTAKITPERLAKLDYYRAQVQFQGDDKLRFAVFYNAIYGFNPTLAAELRDENALAINQNLMRHIRTLLMSKCGFGQYLKEWVPRKVDDKLKPQVNAMLKRHFGDVL